jgi:hypothetical protein
MSPYSVAQYRDDSTGRARWAVVHHRSGVFYFPRRYGLRAARALCDKLIRGAA